MLMGDDFSHLLGGWDQGRRGGGGESIVTRRVFKIPLQKGWGFYFNGQAHFWEIVAHAYPPKQHTVVGCMH